MLQRGHSEIPPFKMGTSSKDTLRKNLFDENQIYEQDKIDDGQIYEQQ